MSVRTRIIVNSVSNFVARFGINLLSFFTLPIFLKHFGDSKYAIFIIINSLVESVVFFDFGVGTSLVKKSAEYCINENKKKFQIYFSWTFWFTFFLAILSSVFIFAFASWIIKVLKIDKDLFEVAQWTIKIFAVYLFLFFILKIYQSILEGFEKFVIINIFRITQYISLVLCIILKYLDKLSFESFIILSILGNLLPLVGYCFYFHAKYNVRLLKGIDIKALFKSDFWQLSKNYFILQITGFLFSLSDKFIISSILGATYSVYYTVVTKISYIIRMVNNQTLIVINPIISKAKEANDVKLLSAIINKGATYQFILMCPFIVTAALFLKSFLILWIGGIYVSYYYWGIIALIIYLLGPFSGMIQRVLAYGGFEKEVKNITLYLVLVNIICSIIFTFYFGIGGVIIGSIIQTVISIPIFKHKAKMLLDINYTVINKKMLISIVISMVAIILFYSFNIEVKIANWFYFLFFGIFFFVAQSAFPLITIFYLDKKK